MAQISQPDDKTEDSGEEYELLPHKEILELREELRALKIRPNEKTLQLSMVELAGKVDKLIDIFEAAMHELRIEEGGISFQEKMKPLTDRMDKILEQNSQIAEGVVAIADMVNEMKDLFGQGARPLPDVGGQSLQTPGPSTPPPMPPPPRR